MCYISAIIINYYIYPLTPLNFFHYNSEGCDFFRKTLNHKLANCYHYPNISRFPALFLMGVYKPFLVHQISLINFSRNT